LRQIWIKDKDIVLESIPADLPFCLLLTQANAAPAPLKIALQ
jgi:hypothetical protein